MYDRAPRVFTQETTGTSVDVGPGKYNPYGNACKRNFDGYAPFLSMATRDTFLTVKESKIAAPGPGTYNPKIYDFIPGGSTLVNQSVRFHEKHSDTPGPGCYSLSKESDWLKNKKSQSFDDNFLRHFPPRNIQYQRKSAPPSIPSPGQAYGYEEGKNGQLQKQKNPSHDNTLGPAYYKINEDDTYAVKKYKGIHFGNMTAKRIKEFKGEDSPGPGTYDPYKPKPKAPIDIILEEQQKTPLESKLPRYHEIISMVESKKAVPGPGHYHIKSQFDRKSKTDSSHRPSFGAQAKRFSNTNENSPAPGSYNDPRHALEICHRITGLKKSPFGQTSTRFEKDHHVRKTPGPGTYDHADLASDLKKKAVSSMTRKGGFGTTADRMAPLNGKKEEELPGPAQYVIKSTPTPSSKKKHAVFESTTDRSIVPVKSDCPPAGSYEVAKSFDRTQGKVLYGKTDRVDIAKKKINGGFLSSTKRFSQPRDVIFKKADPDIPGPGQYDIRNPLIPGGNLVTKEERFKENTSDIPGPGTYQLSPLIQHSVLKSTFNATLNNPVANALEEMQERKTAVASLSVNF